MKKKQLTLWEQGEYFYKTKGFTPFLIAYLHEEPVDRPGILIAPGGAYCICSCLEGELPAMAFFERGYNVFVLAYTTNLLNDQPLQFQPLKDIGRSVALLRYRADELHLLRDQIAVLGFSAGGHLCASLAVHFDAPELRETGLYSGISKRPDAVILCYPVIDFGPLTHPGTRQALLGPSPASKEIDYWSCQNHVTGNTPPVFLWTTMDDALVPMDNSVLFFDALRRAGVRSWFQLFASGKHGISVANKAWEAGEYGDDLCQKQMYMDLQTAFDEGIHIPMLEGFPEQVPGTNPRTLIRELNDFFCADRKASEAISAWPQMAASWLADCYAHRK